MPEKPKPKYHKPSQHARPLKNLEQRFEWYAESIEAQPESRKGAWRLLFAERLSRDVSELELWVDLGCGKGQFCEKTAVENPDKLFVAIDYEETCVALAAQRAHEANLPNLVVCLASADEMDLMFAKGEVDGIYLNYSTPFPRKKYGQMRLTYVDKLIRYRQVLKPEGEIVMRTDSQPFFDFSLLQFDLAGFEVTWQTCDLYKSAAVKGETEYEQRLTARGAKVHALHAKMLADLPENHEYAGPMSLMDFLPQDLESIEYMPYGMEKGIVNFRNRARKAAKRKTQ